MDPSLENLRSEVRGERLEEHEETSSVLRSPREHEKLKIRPPSFAQEHGPVLGEPEVRGQRREVGRA